MPDLPLLDRNLHRNAVPFLRLAAGSVSMMTRKTTLVHLRRAVEPLLLPDETFLTGCSVWMADQRSRVPLLFTGRAIYVVAITSERMLVFDTPRRGRPLLEADLLLQRRHDALELLRARARRPMLQLRIAPAPERVVVLEFRPRDRWVGRQLVKVLRDANAVNAAEPPDTPAEAGNR
jgi:hypothetical protein